MSIYIYVCVYFALIDFFHKYFLFGVTHMGKDTYITHVNGHLVSNSSSEHFGANGGMPVFTDFVNILFL